MRYQLSFFDELGHINEVCESDFEAEGMATTWMPDAWGAKVIRPTVVVYG